MCDRVVCPNLFISKPTSRISTKFGIENILLISPIFNI